MGFYILTCHGILHADSLSRCSGLLGHLNRNIVNVVSNTCAFPTVTSQNVSCEKSLFPVGSSEQRLSLHISI